MRFVCSASASTGWADAAGDPQRNQGRRPPRAAREMRIMSVSRSCAAASSALRRALQHDRHGIFAQHFLGLEERDVALSREIERLDPRVVPEIVRGALRDEGG